jgi:hypothetical protein
MEFGHEGEGTESVERLDYTELELSRTEAFYKFQSYEEIPTFAFIPDPDEEDEIEIPPTIPDEKSSEIPIFGNGNCVTSTNY